MKIDKSNNRRKKSSSVKPKGTSTTKGNSNSAKLKKELSDEKDKYVRLFAEFENFKKRTAKERLELFKTANSDVLSSLIPILDDYDRAIKQSDNIDINDEINNFSYENRVKKLLIHLARLEGLEPPTL